jgi:hypothetical protein
MIPAFIDIVAQEKKQIIYTNQIPLLGVRDSSL